MVAIRSESTGTDSDVLSVGEDDILTYEDVGLDANFRLVLTIVFLLAPGVLSCTNVAYFVVTSLRAAGR